MPRPTRVSLLLGGLAALATVASALPAQAAAARHHPPAAITLSYLGEQELPNALQFQGTTVGGLSAISYDAKRHQYLLISDDRSAKNPARFYTAKIAASIAGLQSVTLTGTHPLLQADGSVFPPTVVTGTTTTSLAPDPEGLAVDPKHDQFAWSSEGERIVSPTAPAVLEDPWVRTATLTGRYVNQYALAPQLHMNTQQVGPRQNQVLEGLSFTPDGRELWSAMEDPIFQDGADPTPQHGALVRVTELDPKRHLPVAQYAYRLQPLFATPPSSEPTDTNGLSDITALGGGRFLVIERAYVAGVDRIRIYLADDHAATDVLARDSTDAAHVTPMHKRLLVDLADVKGLPRIDNVEGITLGPRLKDGRRLLLLVSDDNFSTSQVTQFIAFAAKGL